MADKKNKNSGDASLEESSTIIQPNKPNQPPSDSSPLEDSDLSDNNSASSEQATSKKSSGFLNRLRDFTNFYFIIFMILVLLAAAGVFVGVKFNNKNNKTGSTKTQSLTDKQISDLKGNTTLVGDAQQTLDIQGNSIFEGQVLMRNNLDVAGSIKIGGSLSLPAITVGGASTFGQIQVNDRLSVNGDTVLEGQLTVQKGLTVAGSARFGSLSASQLNVSTIQLTGDYVVSRHIGVSGGTPSRSNGSALGSGGTASVNGTDTAGTVTINTGGSPPAGCFATINFTQRFNITPHVVISPSNSNSGAIEYYTNRSNTSFSVCTASAPSASATYLFDYVVID
jgi:cytoskeletal protein CcmA (bactofilin family)